VQAASRYKGSARSRCAQGAPGPDADAAPGASGVPTDRRRDGCAAIPTSGPGEPPADGRTLGITGTTLPVGPAGDGRDEFRARRRERARLRERLRQYAWSRSVAKCGYARHGFDAEIRRRADGVAYVGGVATCGSPWACPWCAPAIACARAEELSELCERARERGLHATMVTLTLRHHVGVTDPRSMFAGLAKAWSGLTSGRWWVALRRSWGIHGFVRGIEATHGPNGWHPHVHAVFFTGATPSACATERAMVASRWRAIVRRVLGDAFEPDDAHGADVRECNIAEYVAKLGFEVGAGGLYKRAAEGYRTPWDIARAVANRGDPADVSLWVAWQRATYGRKQLTWSRGARDILGRDPATDEACAAEAASRTDEVVASFAPAEWRVLVAAAAMLLDAAERGGSQAVDEVARAVFREALARGEPLAASLARDPRSRFYAIDTS